MPSHDSFQTAWELPPAVQPEVRRVVVAVRGERDVLGRVPGPAGLHLGATDRRDVRRHVRVADDRVVDGLGLAVRPARTQRTLIARGREERVVLRKPALEGLVELRELLARGVAAELGLVGAERHREDRPRRIVPDGPVDRVHQVRQALDALRLRRRRRQQDDVRLRRDRVGPLHVEVRLARPARRLPPGRVPVAGVRRVLVAGLAEREDRRDVRCRPTERGREVLRVRGGRRAAVGVHQHDRLARAVVGGGERPETVERPDLVGRVAVDPGRGRTRRLARA